MTISHPDDGEFGANLAAVRARMAEASASAGRPAGETELMAVTKNFDRHAYELAAAAGIKHVGENRVQEAEEKYAAGHDGVTLHLIGHLQTNKAAKAAAIFDTVDSVDSVRVARALSDAAVKLGRVMRVLIEVNIGDDPDKTGVPFGEAEALCAAASEMPGIAIDGFMTILPLGCDEAQKAQYFAKMRKKAIDISQKMLHNRAMQLSMGMSDDYYEAIRGGSTMIRIGTALFGKRKY